MREKKKRGEARDKRGDSGASRTGMSGAQGQTNDNTVEIRYNGLEGTGEFWLLNPNLVKSNYNLFFFVKKL